MPESAPVAVVSAAVEGPVDEAVVRRLIDCAGGRAGAIYGGRGKGYLHQKIDGYNHAARHAPWVILVDADTDCAPSLREAWLPKPAPYLCFRIAVREIEAWLMADAETLSRYLSVTPSRITEDPESVERPKDAMIHLARHSRKREIRKDMVPREGSGRRVGPAYASRLIEYAATAWRPEVAARRSESLQRAICCLRRLVADYGKRLE